MLICLCLSLGTHVRAATPDTTWNSAQKIIARLPSGSLPERVEAASRQLMGRPYLLGPLGEGDSILGEAKPRFRLDAFDCVTYLETSIALAKSQDTTDLLARMDSIRYLQGKVGWRTRDHFFEGDWLPRNGAFAKVSRTPGDSLIVRRLARREFYGKKGFAVPDTQVQLPVLWREKAISKFAKVSDADAIRGVCFVGKIEGYPCLHTGWIVERKGRIPFLRHASAAGSVREQPLSEYLREKSKFIGIVVWDFVP
jgi:D-alanyl-D-alanine carboxypeptidase/D-alanyl-D-alanine-endopeptidase (penicillin-binding protein 4)